jgi:hypothetical protein
MKSDDKALGKGQVLLEVCKLCKYAGHRMKDYVEFLKLLHKKGIPFREG